MSSNKSSLAALTLGAIGVVYGDIGTSVLYAIKEIFGSGHVPFTHANVYGVLSIVFWTLTVIVSLKYVTLVLRADNGGEGGRTAIVLRHGIQGHAIVAPVARARNGDNRHDLNDVHAEIAQMGELGCGRFEGTLRCEGANV